MTGEDGRGWGGHKTSPTNRAIEESGADGSNDSMARRVSMEAPPGPRDTSADDVSAGALPRKYDCTDGDRTENGMHLRREYGLLALEELEGG